MPLVRRAFRDGPSALEMAGFVMAAARASELELSGHIVFGRLAAIGQAPHSGHFTNRLSVSSIEVLAHFWPAGACALALLGSDLFAS
ncbi:hypothetical protein XH98_07075 [Bradyrhizobium sp. CCBAU 51745]|nr:hypothetical protein [Bradyrhizobium sp. CCBAU 51745]